MNFANIISYNKILIKIKETNVTNWRTFKSIFGL